MDYIHDNPVAAGFITQATQWKYSSARNIARVDPAIEIFRMKVVLPTVVGTRSRRATSNTIRIVKTNSPITKARELFNSLTKHKIGNLIDDGNGVLRANMGNGNYINYRQSSASTSNFPATISLDFRAAGIWTKVRNVKFIAP
ncbi:hypothetical protein HZY62_04845 [Maribacter polysiphoniae]|uniref:Uncharacterized protein n=1 Tax=Maribacter polysiphoniae TaxID=429344 RepID=A0A316EQL9_9FLAO|nr:hypothetical protein [Maribacter polysiphoniae]MBD1259905.1 hypothetical protein [Maribacter polysiphoniae]PWK25360.1 hypothetical protein LX92_00099 [Maribacter polysiphoniae]